MRALFDRIAEPLTYTTDPEVGLSETVESVQSELGRILNCRSFFASPTQLRGEGTILNYGLADLNSIDGHLASRRVELARRIQRAIERYEPRLSNVRVSVAGREGGRMASVEITARIRNEERDIRFSVPIDPDG